MFFIGCYTGNKLKEEEMWETCNTSEKENCSRKSKKEEKTWWKK